jgi:phage terminase large subunit
MVKKKEQEILNIDVQFNGTQQELAWYYLNDHDTLSILYGGGANSGKSYLGCLFITLWALWYPETRYVIGRAELKNLKQTTLEKFFEVCRDYKLKQGVHWSYNQQQSEIRFYNGSVIYLKELIEKPSDPDFQSLGSLELTAAFIDEAGENGITEQCYNTLLSRLRYKHDQFNISPKLLLTCNPTKNFLYHQFYLKDKNNTLESHKKFVPALYSDNKYSTKSYEKTLDSLDVITRSRLKFGEWETSNQYQLIEQSQILRMFDDDYKIQFLPDDLTFYLTVDVARMGEDSTVILVWQGLNVVKIIRLQKKRINELYTVICGLMEEFEIDGRNLIIDGIGTGAGLVDLLIVDYPKLTEFIANGKPLNHEQYIDLRSQMFYKLGDYINGGKIKVYTKDLLLRNLMIRECETIIADSSDGDGKLSIIPKKFIKKLLGRSPDFADSLSFRMFFEFGKKKGSGVYNVTKILPNKRF